MILDDHAPRCVLVVSATSTRYHAATVKDMSTGGGGVLARLDQDAPQVEGCWGAGHERQFLPLRAPLGDMFKNVFVFFWDAGGK